MTDRGVRRLHLLRWLEWTQTHYPWSVLWILFMVGVAMLLTGLVLSAAVVALLFLIVAAQAIKWVRNKRLGRKR
jgi:uncharacterized protein (DUF2062 family)